MAQDTPVPVVANTEPLTVEKALSLALGNPVYAAAGEAGLRAAEARFEAMGLLPSPELRLTYDDRWTGETGQEYAIRFSPPNPWVVGAQKAEGELGINLARIQLDGLRWATAIETRTSFYEALHAQKLIGQADQRKTVTQEKKRLYEMLLTNGQTTLPQVLEVRLDYLEAIQQLESAQQAQQETVYRDPEAKGNPKVKYRENSNNQPLHHVAAVIRQHLEQKPGCQPRLASHKRSQHQASDRRLQVPGAGHSR
ncbi:TolC family protein [Marinobacter nauticus]|uniref:TolC family protein n=1 Tax=Marinobacter nauticus TaxID=2743 RepID=UPI0032B0FEB9